MRTRMWSIKVSYVSVALDYLKVQSCLSWDLNDVRYGLVGLPKVYKIKGVCLFICTERVAGINENIHNKQLIYFSLFIFRLLR